MMPSQPQRPPHIVCFAPYTTWSIHSARQVTILQALRLRGCSVSYVTCDGVFSDCDVLQAAVGGPAERPANACLICQSSVAARLAAWGMPYRWLSRWLSTADFAEAARWAGNVKPHELLNARHDEWEVGQWVRSSVHTHLRHNVLDTTDAKTANVYRSYLYSGLLACLGLSRLLDEEKPDVQLLFNGRMAPTRIALELAKGRGIRTLVEERGATPGRVLLVENTHCMDPAPLHALWQVWKDIPLKKDEIEAIGTVLQQRWSDRKGDIAFISTGQAPADIRRQLDLDPAQPVWALFTSNIDETAGHNDGDTTFPTHDEWVEATLKFAAAHPSIQLVIRVHPNSGGPRSFGSNPQELAFYGVLAGRLPANVRLVPSAHPLNSYTLAGMADLGLVWHSTIGLEMAALGRPVLRAGAGWLADKEFLLGATSPAAYDALLRERADSKPGHHPPPIGAWRFAYLHFIRQSLPFALVRQDQWHTGEMAYETLEALSPGRDAALDRVCDTVMTEAPLHAPPPAQAGNAEEEKALIAAWRDRVRPGAPPVV